MTLLLRVLFFIAARFSDFPGCSAQRLSSQEYAKGVLSLDDPLAAHLKVRYNESAVPLTLLFLTRSDLPWEGLWRRWMGGLDIDVRIHSLEPARFAESPWRGQVLEKPVPAKLFSVELTGAMVLLLRSALAKPVHPRHKCAPLLFSNGRVANTQSAGIDG